MPAVESSTIAVISSTVGAFFGALMLGMTRVGIPQAGIPAEWYFAVLGIVLLVFHLLRTIQRSERLPEKHGGVVLGSDAE